MIAGRIGQEFNQRKNRKGAYWEDRYHATAVETGDHLAKCSVYIDLNMVRAGVVTHPSEWPYNGYNEIQKPKKRYALIDYNAMKLAFGFKDIVVYTAYYRELVSEALQKVRHQRDQKWTESIAVGSESFVKETKKLLGADGIGRKVREKKDAFELREHAIPYNSNFGHKNVILSPKNRYRWEGIY